MIPPHQFLQGLLHHYQIELQHLNPNGIQHIAVFIVLCEGYLGIEPHFELWRYLFFVSLHKKRERSGDLSVPMGCTGIHLWGSGPPSTCLASCLGPTRGGMCSGSM